ncbi:MAG TPA: Gfo/Idh/MocA family oxidoreductase [Pirellulales bacterium]|jgi:predicted dehydrogenase|nr:Gfo/Idh/MocA family oxidoreductase [Pirellulales bacterium]
MSEAQTPVSPPLASRRDFLGTSAAVAVGAGLAGSLSLGRAAHAAGDDTIKIGLIGCGGRGTGAVRDALETGERLKVVAMGDAFEDRLASSLKNLENLRKDEKYKDSIDVPKERQFVGFDAYKQVLEAGVDLVILATPPGFRPIHFQAAIEAGKHVFMEKPVATDAAGVRQVLAAAKVAKEKNLGVGVGLQRRHQAHYIDAMQRLHDGVIGDVLYSRVYWNGTPPWVRPRVDLEKQYKRKLTEMEYQMRNWYYFTWLCGDNICEQHIHNLDVGNWFKGAYPVMASALGGAQVMKGADYGEKFDHHAVEYVFADGTRMFSQCRQIPGCWNSVTEHFHGTKGTAKLDGNGGEIVIAGGETIQLGNSGRGRGRKRDPMANPYRVEHADLLKSIRSGSPENEAERGALSSMTAILGRMASFSGKEVAWDKALNSQLNLVPTEFGWDVSPPVPSMAMPGQTQVV